MRHHNSLTNSQCYDHYLKLKCHFQYDNGGPLMCGEMLAGVISWGDSGCHVEGVVELPTVAASTGYFYDWISTACEGCV